MNTATPTAVFFAQPFADRETGSAKRITKGPFCVVCLVGRIDGSLLCKECRANRDEHVRRFADDGPDEADLVIWVARRVRTLDKTRAAKRKREIRALRRAQELCLDCNAAVPNRSRCARHLSAHKVLRELSRGRADAR